MPDLLPPNANAQERALSLAIDRPIPVPIRELWSPATCPAAQLPWLAWALSVDDWNPTWPEETKRQAIQESIDEHRKKGTVGSLRRALQRLGYEVEIDENTGTAYTFKLRFKIREGDATAGALLDKAVTEATQIALRKKNVRSYLADTDLLAETDPAPLWVGGAVISGAEIDFTEAAEPTPLPLDDYKSGMFGSFWTVRMHSDYIGPIGRVTRESDGASLNYVNTQNLQEFVSGSNWRFTGLFSQLDGAFAAIINDAPKGEFDSNGIPRMLNDSGEQRAFLRYVFPTEVFPNCSICAAGASTGFLNIIANTGGFLALGNSPEHRYFRLDLPKEKATAFSYLNGFARGWTITSPGKLKACAVARFSGLNYNIECNGQSGGDDNGYFSDPSFSQFNFGPGYFTDPFYGACVWRRDVGTTDAAAVNAAVESYLSF